MIIYEFTTWGYKKGELFIVNEIEVEEKEKTYISKKERSRIRKDDIGKLDTHYGNRMYLLENSPEKYIKAMTERCKERVKGAEARLAAEQKDLATWSSLAEEIKKEAEAQE